MSAAEQPWVVVLSPGMDNEAIEGEHSTFAAAKEQANRLITRFDESADVMKRLPDGTLTTEF